MVKRKLDGLDYILRMCSLYILVWTISPPLQHPILFRVLVLGAGLVWLFFSWLKIAEVKTDIHGIYLAVCVFCVIAIMIEWACGINLVDAAISQLQIIILLLFVLQYIYYSKNDIHFIKLLTIVAIICLSIWQLRTLIEYQTNPGVSRLLVKSGEVARYYAAKGIGGYGLIYPSVFSNMALMFLLGQWKGKKRILLLVPLLIGIILVFSSGYLIAVIMTLASLFCWIARMFTQKKNTAIFISIIAILMIIVVCLELLLKYSDFVLKSLEGTFYHQKVKEIINALLTDESTGKLEGRTNRYLMSIQGIFKYPFVGAKILGMEKELGGHSTLIDMLGMYGIVSFCFYYAIISALRFMYKSTRNKGYVIAFIILLLLNGCLNTLVGNHGVIFIVIPGVSLLSSGEGSCKKFERLQ